MPSVRIVILNYNGVELLRQCLPSVEAARKNASVPSKVTVLDNQSTDASESYVKENYPEIEFVKAPENRVLCSYNDYLKDIDEEIAILLNNDIKVKENFIDPMVRVFKKDARTFLVAPKVLTFDGDRIEAAATRAGFKLGMFWCRARYPGYEQNADSPSETFSSGFGAFSREKFVGLDGYDPLYLPGTLEDVDLCLRARRAGYSLHYEPASTVYHMGQATFKKVVGERATAVIAHRNTFLFMWKNYSGYRFWIPHISFLPLRLCFSLISGNTPFVEGFFQALRKKREGKA